MAENVKIPPLLEAPTTVVGGTPTSVFPFDFPFFDTADIIVRVDNVELEPSSFSVVGYLIQDGQAVVGGYGSGQVTLDVPVTDCVVTIDRDVSSDRETQFSRSAPVGMPALNGDLNRLTARQQDLKRRKVDRPIGDVAGQFLAFDAEGNPSASSGTGADAGLRTDLAAGTGSALVRWTRNAVGATMRLLLAKLSDKINPKDFGCVMDGVTDDAVAWQKTVDYAASLNGAIIDLDGGVIALSDWTIPNTRGLVVQNGRINTIGDATWLTYTPGATSITFLTFQNLFIDCSSLTTFGRVCIDWSRFTYSLFKHLWFYNATAGRTICLYAAGDGTVGPYYNVFDTLYGGGHFIGIQLANAASVANTVNNNTMRHIRMNPGASGRFGVFVGTNNQQNRILDSVFEDTVGGTGVYDDGIATFISSSRFEHMTVAMDFGANAAGGTDLNCYFDSNSVKRQFASSTPETLHNSLGESNGDGSAALSVMAGGLEIGGEFRQRGDPGFPSGLATGEGFSYPSTTLGYVDGGKGSTNDRTIVNSLGQTVAQNPTETTNWHVAGALRSGSLYFYDGATFQLVSAGAADSAGTGYRSLRIPN